MGSFQSSCKRPSRRLAGNVRGYHDLILMPLAADIARSAPPSPVVRRLIAFALACLGVFGLDALAFRTRWYPQVLQPDSTTGLFEMVLWRERQAQKRYGDNLVVTVGDSRFGLAPKLSN